MEAPSTEPAAVEEIKYDKPRRHHKSSEKGEKKSHKSSKRSEKGEKSDKSHKKSHKSSHKSSKSHHTEKEHAEAGEISEIAPESNQAKEEQAKVEQAPVADNIERVECVKDGVQNPDPSVEKDAISDQKDKNVADQLQPEIEQPKALPEISNPNAPHDEPKGEINAPSDEAETKHVSAPIEIESKPDSDQIDASSPSKKLSGPSQKKADIYLEHVAEMHERERQAPRKHYLHAKGQTFAFTQADIVEKPSLEEEIKIAKPEDILSNVNVDRTTCKFEPDEDIARREQLVEEEIFVENVKRKKAILLEDAKTVRLMLEAEIEERKKERERLENEDLQASIRMALNEENEVMTKVQREQSIRDADHALAIALQKLETAVQREDEENDKYQQMLLEQFQNQDDEYYSDGFEEIPAELRMGAEAVIGDDELQRAIEMSLNQAEVQQEDEIDEDLALAIQLSQQEM
eukprot:TRINITY_DN10823_c0_g1_i1.p1 TRINITY_DN10823_c0_g1~~TRINITY_DN10823_c0_g1_i1.p1  ORF type:complete len:473 (-),score=170.49 TRINITY_DN10823_c0_g1_i1:9-1391(-)